ncbi:hypothetical protein YC2023_088012 [Brassica napus]
MSEMDLFKKLDLSTIEVPTTLPLFAFSFPLPATTTTSLTLKPDIESNDTDRLTRCCDLSASPSLISIPRKPSASTSSSLSVSSSISPLILTRVSSISSPSSSFTIGARQRGQLVCDLSQVSIQER